MSDVPAQMPPHDPEAEQAVLGSMLLDRDAITRAVDLIRPEDFYQNAHCRIYSAIVELFERGEPADLVTVTDHLRDKGFLDDVGGAGYVTSLLNTTATPSNVEYYARIVIEKARTRSAMQAFDFASYRLRVGENLRTVIAETLPTIDEIDTRGRQAAGPAVLVSLSDVTAKPVQWLWRGRIPLGKVTVLDGDPNLAKSLLSLDLAARISVGGSMPDGAHADLDGPRGVVILSAEDDLEDTIRPRLDAAGAAVERVALLVRVKSPEGERSPTVADLEALEDAIRQTDAVLVIVDPLMAHIPDERDSHRDHDIRRALAPLASLAARMGAAVLVIRHLNKAGGGNPLYRGGGSIGIIGAARSGLLVASDPDAPDSGRRILAVTKSNLAALAPALAFRVEAVDEVPRIVWEGPTAHTADALLVSRLPEEERSAMEEAAAFLSDMLAEGDLPANEVKAAARQSGIAERTLERARLRTGVVTRRQGFGPGSVYVWGLHARPNPHARQLQGGGVHDVFGEHGVAQTSPDASDRAKAPPPKGDGETDGLAFARQWNRRVLGRGEERGGKGNMRGAEAPPSPNGPGAEDA